MKRIIGVLLAALLLSACGADDDPAPSGASGAGGPTVVEHQYGKTEVPEDPQRVVTVGLTEQDTLLALGITPVGTTEWYGDQPGAIWPWARDRVEGDLPEVLSNADGIQFEKIAALWPDLIIGTNAGLERGDYEKLSQIAPTVAGVKGGTPYFSPWEEQTELIAAAVGRAEEGEQLVQDVKDDYAAAAEEHPEFAGKTVTFSQNGFYSGVLYVYPDGLGTEFLTYLGFEINPKIRSAKRGEQAQVSAEKLDLIDADVIVFATEKPQDVTNLKKVPTFNRLDAVKDGRAVYTDPTLAGAMYFMSPLSMAYVLEHLTPQLEDAVSGNAPQRIAGDA